MSGTVGAMACRAQGSRASPMGLSGSRDPLTRRPHRSLLCTVKQPLLGCLEGSVG